MSYWVQGRGPYVSNVTATGLYDAVRKAWVDIHSNPGAKPTLDTVLEVRVHGLDARTSAENSRVYRVRARDALRDA